LPEKRACSLRRKSAPVKIKIEKHLSPDRGMLGDWRQEGTIAHVIFTEG